MACDVLVLTPCLSIGGTEVQLLTMCRALVSDGLCVSLGVLFEYDSRMVDRFVEEGVTVFVDEKDSQRPGSLLVAAKRVLKKVYRLLLRTSPGVIHMVYMKPGAILLTVTRILGHCPIVVSAHSVPKSLLSSRMFRLISASKCIITICVSKSVLEGYGLRETGRNIKVLSNCLPPHVCIRERALFPVDTHPLRIGFVGRLEHIKGVSILKQLIMHPDMLSSDVEWHIVGGGSEIESIRSIASETAKPIIVYGSIKPEKVVDVYDNIDVLICPSRSEAFGLSVLEAMARGCPVFASRVEGLKILMSDYDQQCLLDPDNVEEWAEALCAFGKDKSLQRELSKQSIETAQHYQYKVYRKRIVDIHRRFLER